MMDRCGNCEEGTLRKEQVGAYRDELMGIPIVLYNAVEKLTCESCGDAETSIPDMEGLVCAVALARIKIPDKLRGPEIRFLRHALGTALDAVGRVEEVVQAKTGKRPARTDKTMTLLRLADFLGVRKETVSRWENSREVVGETSEKLLRLIVGITLQHVVPAIQVNPQEIIQMKVRSVSSRSTPLELGFERILMRLDAKKGKVWEEQGPEEHEQELRAAMG